MQGVEDGFVPPESPLMLANDLPGGAAGFRATYIRSNISTGVNWRVAFLAPFLQFVASD